MSSFSNSKKNRSALIAVCIALFLPLVIAVTYFFTSTDQLVAENIKELTVMSPDGSVSTFNSDDKRVIELYAKMMNTSAVVDKVMQLKQQLQKIIRVYDYKDSLQAFADARSGAAIKAVIKF